MGRSRLDALMRLDDDEVQPLHASAKQFCCSADDEAIERVEANRPSLPARASAALDRRIGACAGAC